MCSFEAAMSSIIYSQFYYDQESAFRTLHESAQRELGDRLMPDSAWKQVADHLGFTAVDIETLEAKYTTHSAHQMLRRWSRRDGSTLRVLKMTLERIGRQDVVTFLDDVCKRKRTSSQTHWLLNSYDDMI